MIREMEPLVLEAFYTIGFHEVFPPTHSKHIVHLSTDYAYSVLPKITNIGGYVKPMPRKEDQDALDRLYDEQVFVLAWNTTLLYVIDDLFDSDKTTLTHEYVDLILRGAETFWKCSPTQDEKLWQADLPYGEAEVDQAIEQIEFRSSFEKAQRYKKILHCWPKSVSLLRSRMTKCYALAGWNDSLAAHTDENILKLLIHHLSSRHMEIEGEIVGTLEEERKENSEASTLTVEELEATLRESSGSFQKRPSLLEEDFEATLLEHKQFIHSPTRQSLTVSDFDAMREASGGMYTIMYPITIFHFQQRVTMGLEKSISKEHVFPTLALSSAVNRQTCDTNDLFSLVKDIRDNEHNIVRILQQHTGACIWDAESYFLPFVAVVNRCFHHYMQFCEQAEGMWNVEREANANLLYGMYQWQTHHPRYILGNTLIGIATDPNVPMEEKKQAFTSALGPELMRLKRASTVDS